MVQDVKVGQNQVQRRIPSVRAMICPAPQGIVCQPSREWYPLSPSFRVLQRNYSTSMFISMRVFSKPFSLKYMLSCAIRNICPIGQWPQFILESVVLQTGT